MPKLPFWMLPASWGLKGTSREIARIEYEFDEKEARRRIANIQLRGSVLELELLKFDLEDGYIDERTYARRKIEIEYHGKERDLKLLELEYSLGDYTEKEFKLKKIDLTLEGTDREVALVQLRYDYGEIDEHEAEKQIATINNEPWVKLVGEQSLNGDPTTIGLEVMYNNLFVSYLIDNGYHGNEEQIINTWMNELLKQASDDAPTKVTVTAENDTDIKYE